MLGLKEDKNAHKDKPRSQGQKKLRICLQKVRIWAFILFVQQFNSVPVALKLKLKFQKNKVVTGKNLFFVADQFCTLRFICLRIGS